MRRALTLWAPTIAAQVRVAEDIGSTYTRHTSPIFSFRLRTFRSGPVFSMLMAYCLSSISLAALKLALPVKYVVVMVPATPITVRISGELSIAIFSMSFRNLSSILHLLEGVLQHEEHENEAGGQDEEQDQPDAPCQQCVHGGSFHLDLWSDLKIR